MPGATVWVRTTGGQIHTWEGTADGEGHYSIVPPYEATDGFDIVVASAGYVPSRLRSSPVASEYTMKLEPAEKIGGIVRDESGQPIAGRRVPATVSAFMMTWPEIYASPDSGYAIATTDAQGRWRSDSPPANSPPKRRVRVLVTHSDQVMTEADTTAAAVVCFFQCASDENGAFDHRHGLKPVGRPLRDAAVVVGLRPWSGSCPWEGMSLQLATDKDGKFHTGRCIDPLWPEWVLTVQATGLAIAARRGARDRRTLRRR